ncbi:MULTISPECIES: YggT family protein [unclassified Leucobacter]|uniref:YggT family protein n=1 Tax=unclassified Leucobacter TaxID=2621730 RepID=UPI00165DA628|nr:YggT family protein [Leucobacter sp. CX169]MBC9926917.1 YggT family protein [Leucobacter sp. cx-169]MBC9935121.1 YggT family protein [Leucobacter sp. cx-87]
MEALLIISFFLKLVIRVYTFVLWARFVIDWVQVLNPRFRPRGIAAVAIELVYSLTDPPIKMFRRILPPIRLGQVSLDLGWMLTMLACWILIAILP